MAASKRCKSPTASNAKQAQHAGDIDAGRMFSEALIAAAQTFSAALLLLTELFLQHCCF
jgi:hypothetical protein